MPFRFTLQEVLEYRERVEESRLREMHEVQRQVDQVHGLIEQTRTIHLHYRAELNARTQQGLAPAYQELYRDYIAGLAGLLRRSESHLENLRRDLDRRKERLSQAARERRILDELKKEEFKEYQIEERRIEGKVYDEIGIRNFLMAGGEKNIGSEGGATG